jgi:hypothetical protein
VWNPQTGQWEFPDGTPYDGGDPTGLDPLVGTTPRTRTGGDPTANIRVRDQFGSVITIPSSLLSWYLNMGYTQV